MRKQGSSQMKQQHAPEGVEWQDVADWLVDAGCDHAQGYLWLRPVPGVRLPKYSAPRPRQPQ